MSAVVTPISAPVADAAVVRVVDTGTAAAPHTSAIELENTLISSFTQSGSVSTQWSIVQTFPANEYDFVPNRAR